MKDWCNYSGRFLILKLTMTIPVTIEATDAARKEVMNSPNNRTLASTPARGMINIKECREAAPKRFSRVFHVINPKMIPTPYNYIFIFSHFNR